jgi:hypothetical protein
MWAAPRDAGFRKKKSGSSKRWMAPKDAGFRSRKPATTLKTRRSR